MLKRFDTDGDGKLSEQERRAAMKARAGSTKKRGDAPTGRPGQQLNREEILKKFDTDGDGRLSEEERAALRASIAGRRGGANASRAAKPNSEGRKSRVDKKELLEKFDTDGDGKLSSQERAAAREAFQNRNQE